MMVRTYSEMCKFDSFKDRFKYLQLNGDIGEETFGYDRYLNQKFYQSAEWKRLRDKIIIRDDGCDLAVPGHILYDEIVIHHMNPLRVSDIRNISDILMNPEYLVCVSKRTHNAIHYGDETLLIDDPIERKANDTCPWRK